MPPASEGGEEAQVGEKSRGDEEQMRRGARGETRGATYWLSPRVSLSMASNCEPATGSNLGSESSAWRRDWCGAERAPRRTSLALYIQLALRIVEAVTTRANDLIAALGLDERHEALWARNDLRITARALAEHDRTEESDGRERERRGERRMQGSICRVRHLRRASRLVLRTGEVGMSTFDVTVPAMHTLAARRAELGELSQKGVRQRRALQRVRTSGEA